MKKFLNLKNILLLVGLVLLILGINCLNNPLLAYRYIFLYILIMFGSISLSYIFKKRVDQTIPLYFLISFVFIYFFAIFNILLIGLYLFLVLNIIIDFIVLFKIIKNKNFEEAKAKILTPAFVIYTILFFIFAISTRNAAFSVWDEFTFWSISTKNMYYSNSLYLNSGTTLFMNGYPPCPTIIEYLFCKILGNYSQGIELFAYQMFGFSLFMPFFKNINLKNISSTICIFLSILFIPAIFSDGYFYFTIYADPILGILAGYTLYEYFTSKEDKFLILTMFLSLFCISSTKATGVIIAGILLLILILYYLIDIKKNKKKINIKRIKIIGLLCLSIIISFLSWKFYIKSSDVILNYGYNHPMETKSITDMLKVIYYTFIGTSDEINTTFQTFFNDFFDKGYYSSKPFGMTASCWISIFVIACILIYKFIIKKENKDKYKKAFYLIGLGSVIYILLLQVAYYTQFSEMEAITHASMHRYVGTIFITILMFIVGVVFDNANSKLFIIIPILLLPFTPISLISNATITSGVRNYNSQKGISVAKDFSEFIISNVDKDSKIFPVHQTQSKDSMLIQFRYFMTPISVPMVDMFDDKEQYSHIKFHSKEDFEKELYEKFDYVAVLNPDEYFNEKYGELFEESKVYAWSLYKIDKDKGKVILKRVE